MQRNAIMRIIGSRAAWLAAGIGWALVAGVPAGADDTEIFFVDPDNIENKPNILFILDNSLSMEDMVVSQSPYDPSVTYPDVGCAGRVYWATGSNPDVPNCSSNRWVNRSSFVCKKALDVFAAGGERYRDYMAQYNPSTSGSNKQKWLAISESQKSRYVECRADDRNHGQTDDSNLTRPRDGTTTGWSTSASISWPSSQVTAFDGNYLNWYHGETGPQPKIDIVKSVATNLLNSIEDVNVGLMFFNYDAGGYVAHALEDIETARTTIQQKINNVILGSPYSTYTPLSETLYEAAQYFMGRSVDYGDQGEIKSVAESRSGNTYISPLEAGCQKNFIVYLSDGEPTRDVGADSKITSLPSFSTVVGGCDGSGDGKCLDDLAEYLYQHDLSDLDGDQNVITYTVGFDIDLELLADTARRGGGAYFTANDSGSLSTALTSIIYDILSESSTFSAPAVSINSFNRTRNLNDLFISVFTATSSAHWPGNLKKYRLSPNESEIVDMHGQPAVDATGFFAEGTQSYWSPAADGPTVTAGGAANRIPLPANRKVYTNVGGPNLTSPTNQVATTNLLLDDALLTTGGAGRPTREQVIEFMRGARQGGTQPRFEMGDPLHSQPASVTYTANRTLIYFATNDGYLHAIDTETGIEQWAFIPEEFLPDQVDLYMNEPVNTRHYGIDGNLRVQMIADGDGIIESGEKVYLFFGMRRGGDFYYALDVSNPDAPTVMWRLPGSGAQALPGIGQTWSTPVPARIRVGGTVRNVVIFGAGYDSSHDDYNMSGTDSVGNGIFIVESETGNVLWHGARDGIHDDFDDMNYAIPADVKVVDLNADGLADRMYAADMGGQIWRFDISNGSSGSGLVAGGVIAQLGGAPAASPPISATRRFYYSPDIALVSADPPFIHIGIGSGHRARPNSVFTQDRFYALRDYRTFSPMTQAEYDAFTPIVDADLVRINDHVNPSVPPGSPGWKLELSENGLWVGEKVLAEARTFNNQVFFTTFTPGAGAGGNTNNCRPALGTNRLYVMSLFNGAPVNNMDESIDDGDGDGTPGEEGDEVLTTRDRYREFPGSIASEVVFIFPSPEDESTCVGEECTPPPVACVDLFCFPPGFANNPVRTFWRQESID